MNKFDEIEEILDSKLTCDISVSPKKCKVKWKLLDFAFLTTLSSMHAFIDCIRFKTLFGNFNATNTRLYISVS